MDKSARLEALDPYQSFIVQAPAGSGKTELLTQRVLTLLGCVQKPEEVVALTFTRKAAQEMRHRILKSLQEAQLNIPIKNSHQEKTRELAVKALRHSEKLNWRILDNPQCLQITTFDSFCLKIYQSVPRHQQSTLPELTTYPRTIYKKAIQNWFIYCREHKELHPPLKNLLQQVNNQIENLFNQLIFLLETRDQWLDTIQNNKNHSLQTHLDAFKTCIKLHWDDWGNSLNKNLQSELMDLIKLFITKTEYEKFSLLADWNNFNLINASQLKVLKELLFTGKNELRQCFNHFVGIQKTKCCPKAYEEIQEKSRNILEKLSQEEHFKILIDKLSEFPDPNQIQINWELLQSYYVLLPLLIAHLHLELDAQSKSDYIYVAQQALYALYESDINLYLDTKINHLLIDEFQDTSWTQLNLIEKITENWPFESHKSLFIVGDPMQSIYRFRSADVGIFLSIQAKGLGGLSLKCLYLKQNFRSNTNLIEPFNKYFQNIFPLNENIDLGGVPFHPACPVIPAHSDSKIKATCYESSQEQAKAIFEIIHDAKQSTSKNIAILVKKRKQLKDILAQLNLQQESFQGVDLYPLSESLLIRDVWNLTKLILSPGDRNSECAVLRSCFVGLSLKELHYIANINPKESLFNQEIDFTKIEKNNQQRLQGLINWLKETGKQQLQKPIAQLIQDFVNQSQFHQILSLSEQQELQKFYEIIHYFCEQSIWPGIDNIQDFLNQTYVSSNNAFSLQIMTIHKSKGLEFDWVIIPDMGRHKNKTHSPLLNHFKISPKHPILSSICLPYDSESSEQSYFKWRESQQLHFENQRLCYVAFTRAKEKLFLLDSQIQTQKGSFRDLFPTDFFTADSIETSHQNSLHDHQFRKVVPNKLYSTLPLQTNYLQSPEAFSPQQQAKDIGIICHRLLQWICEYHPKTESEIPWIMLTDWIKHKNLPNLCFQQVQNYIQKFLNHPIGQWIMQPHPDAQNEYPLLFKDETIVREIILDRTFLDQGTRWIIDFKTSFENKAYKKQLNHYAKQLKILYPDQTIACGIFYLASQYWDSWSYCEETLEA